MKRVRIPRATGCIGGTRDDDRGRTLRRAHSLDAHAIDSLGVERTMLHDVLGDLAEERSARTMHDGVVAATAWYARELARSIPHVGWDALRRTMRTAHGRAVVVGAAAATGVLLVAVTLAVANRGVPTRLGLGENDTVVVNNELAVRIPVNVLDETGRTLDADAQGARFSRVSQPGITVSADGEVSCHRSGVVRVHVARGPLSRSFVVQCAPIHGIGFDASEQVLVANGPAARFRIRGIAPDSSRVTRIVGTVAVDDSDVVSIDGSLLRPHRAGTTMLRMQIGGKFEEVRLTVHEAAASPAQIAVDQVYSKTLALAPGTQVRWPIEHGLYSIWLRPVAEETQAPLHLMLEHFNCAPLFAQQHFCVALPGAVLRVIAPTSDASSAPLLSRLVVERQEN